MFRQFGKIEADVVIVGGGVSGITAAYTMLSIDPGLSVYILEAKSNIGGRLQEIELKTSHGNEWFEAGGEFILRSQDHIKNLCQKLGLNMILRSDIIGKAIMEVIPGKIIHFENDLAYANNSLQTYEMIVFLGKLEEIISKVTLTNPFCILNYEELDGMSMEDFINKHLTFEISKNVIKNNILIYTGMEASKISVLFYAAFCNGTSGLHTQFLGWENPPQQLVLKEGTSELFTKMLENIHHSYIIKEDPVINIKWGQNDILIKTKQEISYKSKCLILAIPPKQVLKIDFQPSLPIAKVEILDSILTSNIIKFIVTYKQPFWKDRGFSGDVFCTACPDIGPFSTCYSITRNDIPALCGYIIRPAAKIELHYYKEQVLNQLARYFGNEALSPVDYKEVDTNLTDHSCHSYPPINALKNFNELRRPCGRIFWAGTETATHWNGFMAGAVQAGYRAAVEVIYDIRPQSLNVTHITLINPSQKSGLTKYKKSRINQWRDLKLYLPYACTFIIVFAFRKKITKLLKFVSTPITKILAENK